MIALKQILAATDFSEPAGVALNYGRDLGRAYSATLHIVHVIEDTLTFYGSDAGFALADVERSIEAAVQRDLESTMATRKADPLKVVTTGTRAANVAHAITEYASGQAIDLIIVGTPWPRGGLEIPDRQRRRTRGPKRALPGADRAHARAGLRRSRRRAGHRTREPGRVTQGASYPRDASRSRQEPPIDE